MVKLYYGTKAEYDALAEKESEALYFLTDVRKIMRGNNDFTEAVRFVAGMPANPASGVLYVDTADGNLAKVYDGTKVITISGSTTGLNIDDLGNVTISSVADGQVLKYNATAKKWINGTVSSTLQFAEREW